MAATMTRRDFLLLLDDLLELDPGTLQGSEELDSLDGWDSLAVVSFLAMVDQHLGAAVPPKAIQESETIEDLVSLVSRSLAAD